MHARLVLLLLLVAGCGYNDFQEGVRKPALVLRAEGTVPADSTEYLHEEAGLNLVATFNRAIEAGDISLVQVVPRPQMTASRNPGPNPKQVLIEDAVLDPRYSAYRLVLDGPWMPEPRILSYYSQGHEATEGAMHGHVFIGKRNTEPRNVLIYGVVPPGDEDEFALTGEEETILGRPVLGVTKTIVIPTEEGGWFRLAGLELWKSYMVIGILDTNDDGEYDFLEDWWGYYRNAIDQPVGVVAGVAFGPLFTPPLPGLHEHVDFWLREPGDLDPGFE